MAQEQVVKYSVNRVKSEDLQRELDAMAEFGWTLNSITGPAPRTGVYILIFEADV